MVTSSTIGRDVKRVATTTAGRAVARHGYCSIHTGPSRPDNLGCAGMSFYGPQA